LTYEFCISLFIRLEAAKREKFPPDTIRIWFVEFIRRGWTKKMLQARYDNLLGTKIFGKENIEFADWVNAVPVMAIDEVNKLVKDKINATITRGRFLKDKKIELTEEEKKEVDFVVAREIEMGYERGWFEARDSYKEERRKRILGIK
jgi:hypothetical protein